MADSRRRKKRRKRADAETEALEAFIFGGQGESQHKEDDEKRDKEEDDEEAAAWVDEDDERIQVDISKVSRLRKLRKGHDETVVSGAEYAQRLRSQFNKMSRGVEWAAAAAAKKKKDGGGGDDDDDDDAVFRTTDSLLTRESAALEPGRVRMQAMRDANAAEPSAAVVQAVGFHPSGQVLYTAGLDKRLRLFQVDGVRNAKLQSVYFGDLPILQARLSHDGREMFLSGRRKYFYAYELLSGAVTKVPGIRGRAERSLETMSVSGDGRLLAFGGNNGNIALVSAHTKQWVANVRMNGTVDACEFSADGSHLYATGGDGHVYVWDVRVLSGDRCVARFVDDGCLHGTALALSPDGRYVATGADSGIVNVYDDDDALRSGTGAALELPRPKPLKAIDNLVTRVTSLAFSHDAQVLACASNRSRDAVKLVHVPSLTVFANWPTQQTPLHYVSALAFSANSGYLAVGNARGRVLLYRMLDYSEA